MYFILRGAKSANAYQLNTLLIEYQQTTITSLIIQVIRMILRGHYSDTDTIR